MPRDSGRTGSAGNKLGKKAAPLSKKGQIYIRMKHPMIHLTGEGTPAMSKKGKKSY